MAADNQVEFEIVARLDSLDASLKRLEDKAEKTGEKVGNSLGDKVEKRVSDGFRRLVTGAIAAAAAYAAAFSFKNTIEAAISQENAINRLNQSLMSAGTFTNEASKRFQDLANEIQRTTTIQDDQVLSLAALARNFTATNEQAERLTRAAVDLSKATGTDLSTAVEQLGKTLSGSAGRLAQSVPAIRGLTEEQLKAGAAIDLIAKRFEGAAKGELNTFQGALLRTKNQLGELQEALGNIVIKSPAVTAAVKFIGDQFDILTGRVTKLGEKGDPFRPILIGAAEVAKFFTVTFGPIIEVTLNLVKALAKSLGAFASVAYDLFSGNFKAALEGYKQAVAEDQESFSDVFSTAGSESALKFINGFETAVGNAPPVGQVLKDQAAQNVVEIESLYANISFEGFVNSFRATQQEIIQMSANLMKTLKTTFVSGLSGAFSSIGAALVKGENAFAAFGKAILGVFGDLAIQLGGFYLALGLANLFFNPAAAAAQLAGGAALLVVGGALKALSGGGGADAPSTATGSGAAAPLGFSGTSATEPEQQRQGTGVVVNIQGNVLGDKRTLGREIAEAINESFGADGVVIARGALS